MRAATLPGFVELTRAGWRGERVRWRVEKKEGIVRREEFGSKRRVKMNGRYWIG